MRNQIIIGVFFLTTVGMQAQNLISSGSPLYKLPYKDTYVREPLVAENHFRTAKVEHQKPGTFEQARKILPAPYWEGHEKEIEMYWKAWQIGLTNVSQPLDDSGFVTPYISPAYNGNIFMWDCAFITMFCRYGKAFFPFQKTLDNFYAKQHPDGFICREIRADGSDCFGRYGSEHPAVVGVALLHAVRRRQPPEQGIPCVGSLLQVAEAQPYLAQRHVLVERLGNRHGQYAACTGKV